MFGSVGFLLHGNLLVGIWKDSLIVRLGPDEGDRRCSKRTSRSSTSRAGQGRAGCWSPRKALRTMTSQAAGFSGR